MTILVTGGAGFIGSNFVLDWLTQSDERIVNLDKLTYAGSRASLLPIDGDDRHQLIVADICDERAVSDLLVEHRPRAVVHFAAESHVDRSLDDPGVFLRTNIDGTFNLLRCALTFFRQLPSNEAASFRFLHVSTDEVYGSLSADEPAFSESNAYRPNSPYSASKAASDHFVRAWHHSFGLPTLTTQCSNNYGPRQFPEKLIPLVITNALAEKPLPIYGDGRNVRDWLHVSDHCDALRCVLASGTLGETYNVGGNNERANIDLVRAICTALDELQPRAAGSYAELITFVKDRPGHDRRYAIDNRKITSQLGWSPRHTVESGIRATIEWYLANSQWLNAVRSEAHEAWLDQQYREGENPA
ncbi:dTDP-glucose 4,6-dehydratase [Sphingomonas psychrotolerans]|uniref:dTDP-glucose 4,6-dehydratase n=1 Tax=Sphingomonas psychrotolerans TaxID=1327635 RepID=A0A2K8MQK7_9SPHN|nr:dTDP-glucose 4,6-dehydratase [Sphingomonas psychrotolerans]ATY34289.1 dTDP-glucose 4,6-dehydratase [Sphingomonas psychrotolerans]